ncbi:hypothetical protein B0H17DRAFT_1033010 [Mycena rosella]|uniref:Uncharacterized protein n=1 Tax=Mycena rosella TaxID=1033263 RepID=A0AAD7M9Y7_MYCRO|nr:hypothetical protein B0H17DRAFT_1033010 [Mycena rosella]
MQAASVGRQLHLILNRDTVLRDFTLRLRRHLELTGAVSFAPGTPDQLEGRMASGRWVLIIQAASSEFPNPNMDGAMIQRKLWTSIVHEVAEYHPIGLDRIRQLHSRATLGDMLRFVAFRVWSSLDNDFASVVHVPGAHTDGPDSDISPSNSSPSTSSSGISSSRELFNSKHSGSHHSATLVDHGKTHALVHRNPRQRVSDTDNI